MVNSVCRSVEMEGWSLVLKTVMMELEFQDALKAVEQELENGGIAQEETLLTDQLVIDIVLMESLILIQNVMMKT